jgi:hypothetical protein
LQSRSTRENTAASIGSVEESWTSLSEGGDMYLRFVCAWLVIVAVASYDAYLTVKHRHVMPDVELNPLGRLVLQEERGVALLIGLKTAGIALSLLFCFGLWQSPAIRRKVLIASYSVAALSLVMIAVMNDDSERTRRIEDYHRGLNAAEIPTDNFINQPDSIRDAESSGRIDRAKTLAV